MVPKRRKHFECQLWCLPATLGDIILLMWSLNLDRLFHQLYDLMDTRRGHRTSYGNCRILPLLGIVWFCKHENVSYIKITASPHNYSRYLYFTEWINENPSTFKVVIWKKIIFFILSLKRTIVYGIQKLLICWTQCSYLHPNR